MTPIRLARREPAHNRLRFYAIAVTRTLFDGWALVREWGRIGQAGTVRETGFEAESAAIEAGAKVRQQKEKRGYRVLAVPGMPGSATECVESCPRRLFIMTSGGHGLPSLYRPVNLVRRSPAEKQNPR